MKRLIAAFAFVCLAVSAWAQTPACIQVTDQIPSIGVVTPGWMNGSILLSLGYSQPDGVYLFPQQAAKLTIANGIVSWCAPPGIYTAQYSVTRPPPLTGSTPSTRYWTIPATGGPYTVLQIETVTPPTPPIYTLSVTSPLTYSGGVIGLLFTPENVVNKDAVSGYAGLTAGGLLKLAEAPTWNQDTTGNAGSATALASAPTLCTNAPPNEAAAGIDVHGNAVNCRSYTLTSTFLGFEASLAPSATIDATNASNITSGTLPHAQLPTLLSGDIPSNAANTSGDAGRAESLIGNPINCSSGQAPQGINVTGDAQKCTAYLTGNQTVTLGGDLSGSGTTSITGTIVTVDGSTAANIHTAEQITNSILTSSDASSTVMIQGVGSGQSNSTFSVLYGPSMTAFVSQSFECGPTYGSVNQYSFGLGYNSQSGCEFTAALGSNDIAVGAGCEVIGIYSSCYTTDSYVWGFSATDTPTAFTTPGTLNGTTSITVASGSGIQNGYIVIGNGIPAGSTVTGSGTSWTLSPSPATISASGVSLTFFAASYNAIVIGNHASAYQNGSVNFGGAESSFFGDFNTFFFGPQYTNHQYGNAGAIKLIACGGGKAVNETNSGANSAGCDMDVASGPGTGTAAGGTLRFQTAPTGSSGSTQNALVDRITISSAGLITFPGFSSSGKVPVCFNNGVIYAGSNSGTPCP